MQPQVLVKLSITDGRPLQDTDLGDVVDTKREERVDDSQQFNDPFDNLKMLLVLGMVRVGYYSLLNRLYVYLMHYILEEVHRQAEGFLELELLVV